MDESNPEMPFFGSFMLHVLERQNARSIQVRRGIFARVDRPASFMATAAACQMIA